MAMQTYVFLKREKLPTEKELQAEIEKQGINYKLNEAFDISIKKPKFFEGSFEGLKSGFDYHQEKYESSDWDWEPQDLEKLPDPDVVLIFNTYSNAQEIVGMLSVSSAITKVSEGAMYSDFFDEDLWTKDNCIEISKEIIEDSKSQFNGPSQMRR